VHAEAGRWAGSTLGSWHAATAGSGEVARVFDDFEAFEQLRLRPFLETAMERRPELAAEIAPRLAELRADRRPCTRLRQEEHARGLPGRWVLDFEVAHYGNPVSTSASSSRRWCSAVRWPALTPELRSLGDEFLAAYEAVAGDGFAGDPPAVTAHTACLILARTDGKSPAQFFDPPSRERAREVGVELLRRPERGLWSWA
jgi:hypothetical protein